MKPVTVPFDFYSSQFTFKDIDLYLERATHFFFISNTFTSNTRLKVLKKISKS